MQTREIDCEHRAGKTGILLRVNTQDGYVVDEVMIDNEYGLPPSFEKNDLIVDVGAHIGIFTMACMARGAGRAVCIEPDVDNFEILRANVGERDGVALLHRALWNDAYPTVNFHGRGDYTAQGYVADKGEVVVRTVGLDKLIEEYRDIRLLKLDCEGAEWPALYTSNLLRCGYVRQIVAEMHLGMPIKGFDCSLPGIYRHMKWLGFDVFLQPGRDPRYNWYLHAWKE